MKRINNAVAAQTEWRKKVATKQINRTAKSILHKLKMKRARNIEIK